MADRGVGVKATFSVQGQTVHEFSSSAGKESPPPAAAGIGEQVGSLSCHVVHERVDYIQASTFIPVAGCCAFLL